MRRGIEDLLITKLLKQEWGKVEVSEAITSLALQPYWPPGRLHSTEDVAVASTVLMRTSTVMVIGGGEMPLLLGLMTGLQADDSWEELPPLPYPRLWVEFGGDDNALPATLGLQSEEGEVRIHCVAITGDAAGWWILSLVHRSDAPDPLDWEWIGYRVEPGGFLIGKDDRRSHVREEMGGFGWLPVILAEVVQMTDSRHDEMKIPRPHARAHQRRFGIAHPTVYFLDLRYAGDRPVPTGTGLGYRHRWMVRGHWRRYKSGERTWIRPYVKGPAGAPWKGRPFYTTS